MRARRRHPIAAVIEDATDEQGIGPGAGLPARLGLRGELGLNRLEQVPVDDRLMLSRIAAALMPDLTEVDPVPEEIGEGTLAERAPRMARRQWRFCSRSRAGRGPA